MHHVTAGLFKNVEAAGKAIDELRDAGYDDDTIGIITSDAAAGKDVEVEKESRVSEGAAIGAGTGGAIAALAVGFTSVGAVATGGVGLIAAGPVVAALAGAGAGAAGGGLIGSLIGLGMSDDEAKLVDSEVSDGAALVAVEPEAGKADPENVFAEAGAERTFVKVAR